MKHVHEVTKELHKVLVSLGFEADEPETNMIFISSEKLQLPFEKIIEEMTKRQEGKDVKVIFEGEGTEARIVVHHQTPLESVTAVKDLLTPILKDLKTKE